MHHLLFLGKWLPEFKLWCKFWFPLGSIVSRFLCLVLPVSCLVLTGTSEDSLAAFAVWAPFLERWGLLAEACPDSNLSQRVVLVLSCCDSEKTTSYSNCSASILCIWHHSSRDRKMSMSLKASLVYIVKPYLKRETEKPGSGGICL